MTNPTPNNDDNNFNKKINEMLPFEASTKDLVAYIILILGIILLFFMPIYGGLLIGLVAGVYFSKEIVAILKNFNQFIEQQGVARSLVIAGLLLAFLIVAPSIFIGAAIVVCLRWFVFSNDM